MRVYSCVFSCWRFYLPALIFSLSCNLSPRVCVGTPAQPPAQQGILEPTQRAPELTQSKFKELLERLNQRHEEHGHSHPELLQRILNDLEHIQPEKERLRMMNYFLDISEQFQQWQKAESSGNKDEAALHRALVRRYIESVHAVAGKNPILQDLVSSMRTLARGPEGRAFISKALADLNPNSSKLQREAAQDSFRAGNYRDGITYAQRAVGLDSRDAQAYSTMAGAKLQLKDYTGAYTDAKRALAIDSNDPLAQAVLRFAKGEIERRRLAPLGQISQAAASASKADFMQSQARPMDPAPQFSDRLEDSKRTSSAEYAKSQSLSRQAEALLQKGDYEQSLKSASAAIEANPENLKAHYLRVLNYLRLGMYGQALKEAQQGLQMAPESSKATWLVLEANILNRMKKYDDARRLAQEALALKPDSAEAHLNLGWAEWGLGNREQALSSLNKAAALDSRYRPYYEEALQLPEDSDLALLFDPTGMPRPRQSAQDSSPEPRRPNRALIVVLSSLVGGFLIALGLLHMAGGQWTTRIRSAFSGLQRRTQKFPAVQENALGGGMQAAYRILKKIGSGGMGVVYEAFDKKLERRVAIKRMREEIRSDPKERERFLREARTVAGLHHPNIVDIYSIVEDGLDVYLVFQYVDGKTVHEIIHRQGKMGWAQALALVRDVAAALDYAHKRGVIHRDLKPSNIMINDEGQTKVMDFGVARQAKDSLNRLSLASTISGTPPYMAPEQEQGLVRKESDVYALAVCLYEMVTGSLPFSGSGAGMLMNKMHKIYDLPSKLASGLPAGLDGVMARALEPDPNQRLRSAGEFARSLEALEFAGKSFPQV